MKVKDIKIELLKEYENNPRNNDAAIDFVAKSIKEFGFKVPIVVDSNNVIVAGHTRLKAAQRLGLKTVPCIIADDLTPQQIKAFRLADNKVAENATWDERKLHNELLELKVIAFDIAQFGFETSDIEIAGVDVKAINEKFENEKSNDIAEDDFDADAVIESIVEPTTKRGQVWKLGEHRLMCGDSTNSDDIAKLIDENKIDIVVTDPPYGINADVGVGGFGSSRKTAKKYNDDWDNFSPDKKTFEMIISLAKHSIIFGANYFSDKLPLGKHWIVWDKVGDIKFKNPFSDCELAWTNFEKIFIKKYTVIQQGFINEDKEKRVHPTQKSVKLICYIIKDYTSENEAVIDLFGGSGTTLIACEQMNRRCFMMELDPKYCDVIIARWEELTGKEAILIDD